MTHSTVDKQGVMVTAETWAEYERAVRGEDCK
jgi:hypothetical protein